MNYIIVGMGNFGSYLAIRLTEMGHEVIGVDTSMEKIDQVKDKVSHAVNLDATVISAVRSLPITDSDAIIVAIGEDFGASIMATAIFKQLEAPRLIGRAISPLHETVLQAIGVDEIIHPEEESADRFSKRLEMKGVIDSLILSERFNVIEAEAPARYVGKTIAELDLRGTYNINVVTIIRHESKKNLLGQRQKVRRVMGVVKPETRISEGDVLVLFGDIRDVQEMLRLE